MLDSIKQNQKLVSIIAFCASAILVILLSTLLLKQSAVAVCLLIIIQTGIAVLLHQAELWLHGVLIIAELIAGFILGKATLVILCAIIYVAATITLKYIRER